MEIKTRNWPKILADLRAAGYLTYKIAVAVGVKWDTVKNWEQGNGEPRYSAGVHILEIYREVYGYTEGAFKEALPES